MALTIRNIAVDLDSHVRYASTGKSDEQIAYQVATINRALEEIRVLCPQELRTEIDLTWAPGVAITTTVAGRVIGPNATLADYAAGCSLNINGDSSFNQLVTVGDGSTAGALLFPYSGASGSQTLTIYGDCVKLGVTVDRVLGCELLHERRPLQVLNSRADWLAYQRLDGYGYRDYGINNVIRTPGVPRGVWLETCLNGNAIEYRAHCAPLPNGAFRATMDVATMAEDITADDLAGTGVTGLTVAGTLTPDAAGDYSIIGSHAGRAAYGRVGTDEFYRIYHEVGDPSHDWYLQDLGGNVIWSGPATVSPLGAYTATTNASGTATVVLSVASSTTRPVPGNRVYGILRALCMFHWMGSPWFRPVPSVQKVIEQDYMNATQQAAVIRPSSSATIRSAVLY